MRLLNMRSMFLAVGLVVYTVGAAVAQPTATPQPPTGSKVAVYPPDINLETSRDRQSFVVQLTQPDGITRDVTAQAQVTFANPALVRLAKFAVYPVADGTTEMSVAFNGQTVKVPVKVV